MEKLSYWWKFREGKETTIVIIMAFVIGSVGFIIASYPVEPKDPDICTSFCIRDINDVPRHPHFFEDNPDLMPEKLKKELRG